MQETKSTEQSQDSKTQGRHSDLDRRYGKIGISAVAAAVRHQSEHHSPTGIRSFLYDRD